MHSPAFPLIYPDSEALERITRMATRLFGVSGAAIALHDGGVRLAARTGLPDAQASLCTAFCTALPVEDGVAVSEDADGFFAAVPLRAPDGGRAGTLCLFDPAPARFGDDERALLCDLAATAEALFAGAARRLSEGGLPGPAAHAPSAGERRLNYLIRAAHELRTPLASILGFSELLLKREFDPAGREELLEIVHGQAGRMAKVVNQVFELARIEAGGTPALRSAPTTVDGALVQALASVEALGQNARVSLELAPDLAPVAADPSRLAQAFGLALHNAIRFSSAPTPVSVRAWNAPGGGVAVEIRDGGSGMTAAVRERLFEPFYRGPDVAATEGTGLGMAIFKEIMDLHNARVELDSAPGAGTALTVLLPALGGIHG